MRIILIVVLLLCFNALGYGHEWEEITGTETKTIGHEHYWPELKSIHPVYKEEIIRIPPYSETLQGQIDELKKEVEKLRKDCGCKMKRSLRVLAEP